MPNLRMTLLFLIFAVSSTNEASGAQRAGVATAASFGTLLVSVLTGLVTPAAELFSRDMMKTIRNFASSWWVLIMLIGILLGMLSAMCFMVWEKQPVPLMRDTPKKCKTCRRTREVYNSTGLCESCSPHLHPDYVRERQAANDPAVVPPSAPATENLSQPLYGLNEGAAAWATAMAASPEMMNVPLPAGLAQASGVPESFGQTHLGNLGPTRVVMDSLVCNKCGSPMRLGSERLTLRMEWRCSKYRAGKAHCDVKYDAAMVTTVMITNRANARAG